MTTYTRNELHAAAAIEWANSRISDEGPTDEAGYPARGYREAYVRIQADLQEVFDALGVTKERADQVRWETAFEHKGTREERVVAMGEYWVRNQEERGVGPVVIGRPR